MSCKPTYKGKRYNSLEELYNANGANTQEAQQLYSYYLETTSNPTIEGFREFVTTRNIINTYGINITNEDDIRPVETNINNEEKSLKLALKGLTPEEKISFCNHFGITMTEENGTKC